MKYTYNIELIHVQNKQESKPFVYIESSLLSFSLAQSNNYTRQV